jgi:hypothetical protein
VFRLMLADLELGTSALDAVDAGTAVATGTFVPSSGYAEVASLFRRITDATEARSVPAELWAERDALGLTIIGPDDVVLPTEFVTVYDFGDELDRELEAKLVDVGAWRRAHARGDAG